MSASTNKTTIIAGQRDSNGLTVLCMFRKVILGSAGPFNPTTLGSPSFGYFTSVTGGGTHVGVSGGNIDGGVGFGQ